MIRFTARYSNARSGTHSSLHILLHIPSRSLPWPALRTSKSPRDYQVYAKSQQ